MLRRLGGARAAALLLLLPLAAACSTLPPPQYPPFTELDVHADCVVPADGRLRVPASSRDCVVYELATTPDAAGEAFGGDGERWLLFAPGTRVRVGCRFRVYAAAGDPRRDATTWLPHAVSLEGLTPRP